MVYTEDYKSAESEICECPKCGAIWKTVLYYKPGETKSSVNCPKCGEDYMATIKKPTAEKE